jgi:hypothetical protein
MMSASRPEGGSYRGAKLHGEVNFEPSKDRRHQFMRRDTKTYMSAQLFPQELIANPPARDDSLSSKVLRSCGQ